MLYLTAERFRYQFVEAIKSQDAMAFKDKFRSIDILLIDDLEFMRGEKTEQEFEHIINSLLDGGRRWWWPRPGRRCSSTASTIACARACSAASSPRSARSIRRCGSRCWRSGRRRSGPSIPPSSCPSEVVALLADRLTESGRELEGAINRLYLTWQLMHAPVTLDIAETIIRDLVQGIEPRRIKIEDILRIVSRHFAVSKQDILSQRRHRSVVRPRQIGMYLAKHLTSRSLPEIGRRFGDRDHTTVLHAIRKIDKEVGENPRLKDEIEELKRQLQPLASDARTSESVRPGGSIGGGCSGEERRLRRRRSCIVLRPLRIPGICAGAAPCKPARSRSTLPEACESLKQIRGFLDFAETSDRPRRGGHRRPRTGSNRRGKLHEAGDRTR